MSAGLHVEIAHLHIFTQEAGHENLPVARTSRSLQRHDSQAFCAKHQGLGFKHVLGNVSPPRRFATCLRHKQKHPCLFGISQRLENHVRIKPCCKIAWAHFGLTLHTRTLASFVRGCRHWPVYRPRQKGQRLPSSRIFAAFFFAIFLPRVRLCR